MSWIWLVAVLVLLVLVVVYLRKLNHSRGISALPAGKPLPYNPSVIVDMDDKPPTEIDFDAGIKANRLEDRVAGDEDDYLNQRSVSKNPSQD